MTSVDAPDVDVSKVAYLKIESISADFVIQDPLIPLTATVEAKTGKAMTSVHQKFSIKFMKKGEDTDGIIQGTSGSPGYIDGLPLLIGKGDTSGATQIYEDGFRLSGGDIRGHCMGTVSNGDLLAEMGDPTVRFNVDLSYGCILPYTF